MPVSLEVPSASFSSIEVPLGGNLYNITYSFNGRDNRWRMSITTEGEVLISGLKIMENQSLLTNYRLPSPWSGNIACVRVQEVGEPVGRDNLGVGKPYELLYFTQEEVDSV